MPLPSQEQIFRHITVDAMLKHFSTHSKSLQSSSRCTQLIHLQRTPNITYKEGHCATIIGGLCYTVSRLAPRAWVPSISWIVGWLNLVGQVAVVASSEYGSARLLLAAVGMNSGRAIATSPRAGEQLALGTPTSWPGGWPSQSNSIFLSQHDGHCALSRRVHLLFAELRLILLGREEV